LLRDNKSFYLLTYLLTYEDNKVTGGCKRYIHKARVLGLVCSAALGLTGRFTAVPSKLTTGRQWWTVRNRLKFMPQSMTYSTSNNTPTMSETRHSFCSPSHRPALTHLISIYRHGVTTAFHFPTFDSIVLLLSIAALCQGNVMNCIAAALVS